jgi:uncharacterized pyridoxal phosphate-containing UPF0001 family protein
VDRLAAERGVRVRVLLEVNASAEASKHGVEWDHAMSVAAEISELEHLELCGLMAIGPMTADAADTRVCFRRLAALRRTLQAQTGLPLAELSGMSDDFEIAWKSAPRSVTVVDHVGQRPVGPDRRGVQRPT